MRTNIFKKIFVVVLTITLAFSFVACGETKDDSSSHEGDSVVDNSNVVQEYKVFEKTDGNKFLSARQVVSEGNHSQVTVDSWYDDDNYCYIVYLGRIKNFILYDLYTFEYTDAMPVLGGLSVSLKQVEQTTIENTYSNTVSKSINNKVFTAITNTLSTKLSISNSSGSSSGADAKVKNLFNSSFSAEMSSTIESSLQQTWETNCTETNSEVYTTITSQTNEMIQSFTIDYSKCEPGTFYSFASVTDVDVYVAMSYNPQNALVQYKYYTDVLSRARMAAFASSDDSFLYDNGIFEIDTSDFSFEKPAKYITNHPKMTHTYRGDQEYKIPSGNRLWLFNPNEENLPLSYLQKGYDLITISFSFKYTGTAKLHLCVSDTTGKNKIFYKLDNDESGEKTGSFTLSIQEFCDYGKIYFIFDNENVLFSYSVHALNFSLTFYCSRAKY